MKLKPQLINSLTDDKFRDYGLLLLRVGIGLIFVTIHGFPKITGGVEKWTVYGKVFNDIVGISFIPSFWGFMAAISEFAGAFVLSWEFYFDPRAL